MKHFALVGAAGYIAPKHMEAIKETSNQLVAAFDPNDSVGVMDRYFPATDFFTEFERFDRHIDKLRRQNEKVDFISICSPNYLHDSHIRFALRSNTDAICEKPVVLNQWNIDALQTIEKETGNRVFTILQLRCHPAIVELKQQIHNNKSDTKFDIDLTYITARGNWYFNSWKGDEKKSGGLSSNIGVHLFDMLYYLFGKVQSNKLHYRSAKKEAGFIEYERARVRWFLSVDVTDIPENIFKSDVNSFKAFTINGAETEFSKGFTNLHTNIYKNILSGNGTGLEDSRMAIETIANIRTQLPQKITADYHPFLKKIAL